MENLDSRKVRRWRSLYDIGVTLVLFSFVSAVMAGIYTWNGYYDEKSDVMNRDRFDQMIYNYSVNAASSNYTVEYIYEVHCDMVGIDVQLQTRSVYYQLICHLPNIMGEIERYLVIYHDKKCPRDCVGMDFHPPVKLHMFGCRLNYSEIEAGNGIPVLEECAELKAMTSLVIAESDSHSSFVLTVTLSIMTSVGFACLLWFGRFIDRYSQDLFMQKNEK